MAVHADSVEEVTLCDESIYLPMLVGRVLTIRDESFYKAFCGEMR